MNIITRASRTHCSSLYTVKFVPENHHRDHKNVFLLQRWSLYTGSITWGVYSLGFANTILIRSFYRWYLQQLLCQSGVSIYQKRIYALGSIYFSIYKYRFALSGPRRAPITLQVNISSIHASPRGVPHAPISLLRPDVPPIPAHVLPCDACLERKLALERN